MEIALIRKHLHQYIDKAVDEQIQEIYTLLEAKVEALQETISIEQYNKEIEASEAEYDNGNFITHSELRKEAEQW